MMDGSAHGPNEICGARWSISERAASGKVLIPSIQETVQDDAPER